MDGNGRWATKQGMPRSFGHNKGVSVLKEILKASKKIGCKVPWTILSSKQFPLKYPCIYKERFGSGSKNILESVNIVESGHIIRVGLSDRSGFVE